MGPKVAHEAFLHGGRRSDGSRVGVLLAAICWLIAGLAAYFFWRYLNQGVHGLDSHAYWLTGNHADLYGAAPGTPDAYLYSPAFAQLIAPMTLLPWPIFRALWMLLEAAAFAWLLAPLGIRWGVPAFLLCTLEISIGNIYSFLAVAVVLGMRRPAFWIFPLFTKVSPCLGPVWFAVRREWRHLLLTTLAGGVVLIVSVLASPHLWSQWLHFILGHSQHGQGLLPVRVATAAVITVWAARKNRPELLVFAVLLANPMVEHAYMSLTLLAAFPRMHGYRKTGADVGRRDRSELEPPVTVAGRV